MGTFFSQSQHFLATLFLHGGFYLAGGEGSFRATTLRVGEYVDPAESNLPAEFVAFHEFLIGLTGESYYNISGDGSIGNLTPDKGYGIIIILYIEEMQ